MNNCFGIGNNCKRVLYPAGVWDLDDIVGAKVRIKSTSASNFINTIDNSVPYTIESVNFRVSIDGKALTIITIKDIDAVFTFKDLEFIEITGATPITNETVSGAAICGTGGTSLEDQLVGKVIEVETKEGDLCSGSFVRIITEEELEARENEEI